ncbi:GNAT family N-acetyltransferase [Halosegnis marinus]|uniref:GNAT family N-acetyltransferase n=1 Tax=Halosegnis marinus TaxID=3034023 RepID=UPI0036143CA5
MEQRPGHAARDGGQSVPFTLAEEYESYEAALADGDSVTLLTWWRGEPVGGVELDVTGPEADAVEIAYWLVPEVRGEGLARDAVATLLDYAFDEFGAHRVHAEAFAFNEASARLLGALGFTNEGRLRENHFADGRYYDTLVFGLLADER